MEKVVIGFVCRELSHAGKPEFDRAIMEITIAAIKNKLEQKNIDFEIYQVEEGEVKPGTNIVMNMSRDAKILDKLAKLDIPVINNPQSVKNMLSKETIYEKANEIGITIPETRKVKVRELKYDGEEYYVKRADIRGKREHRSLVNSIETLDETIKKFEDQGVGEVLIQKAIEGEVIKFYGVGEEAWFVGFEPISQVKLKIIKLAEYMNVEIFGGAVIKQEGKYYLITINEWPTFSVMREKGSEKIAELILKKLGI
ncbi:hypothetical protein KO465_02425 [Candidatus Micrarchaeota archaeon]|nr:hypothetical protein [Candidatus Micrarchaeota archaeon]